MFGWKSCDGEDEWRPIYRWESRKISPGGPAFNAGPTLCVFKIWNLSVVGSSSVQRWESCVERWPSVQRCLPASMNGARWEFPPNSGLSHFSLHGPSAFNADILELNAVIAFNASLTLCPTLSSLTSGSYGWLRSDPAFNAPCSAFNA